MSQSSHNHRDSDGLHCPTNHDSSGCCLEVEVVLDGDYQKNDDVGDDQEMMIACYDCDVYQE